ncbi:hypothetical protein C5T95_02355 [Raoultella ornithinolytica]|nr:hypothetical protein C5T95_02355 [Raoultella ornithinolytica]
MYPRQACPLYYVEVFWQSECELSVKDYRFVSYLTAIATWPVTLTLSSGVSLYTKCRGLGVVPIILFMLVAVAAWQFEYYI